MLKSSIFQLIYDHNDVEKIWDRELWNTSWLMDIMGWENVSVEQLITSTECAYWLIEEMCVDS